MDKQTEVVETKTATDRVDDGVVRRETVSRASTPPATTILQRFVYFVTGIIITLLAIRMLLLLLAANQGNVFVDFIYALSGVFAAPFYGIFNYQPAYGSFVFEISSVVAILVYALVGWGIARLLTIGTDHPEAA